ncbi:MAG: hypothetical protein IJL07_06480 [Lachnospiraceae bacterium]|nr:hypothetical protein [Lachnospiraceae bacterium]
MDEKKLKEIIGRLSEEQKAKALKCKNEDELLKFLGEVGIELPDELLVQVSGGGFYKGFYKVATGSAIEMKGAVTGSAIGMNSVVSGPAVQMKGAVTGPAVQIKNK